MWLNKSGAQWEGLVSNLDASYALFIVGEYLTAGERTQMCVRGEGGRVRNGCGRGEVAGWKDLKYVERV